MEGRTKGRKDERDVRKEGKEGMQVCMYVCIYICMPSYGLLVFQKRTLLFGYQKASVDMTTRPTVKNRNTEDDLILCV